NLSQQMASEPVELIGLAQSAHRQLEVMAAPRRLLPVPCHGESVTETRGIASRVDSERPETCRQRPHAQRGRCRSQPRAETGKYRCIGASIFLERDLAVPAVQRQMHYARLGWAAGWHAHGRAFDRIVVHYQVQRYATMTLGKPIRREILDPNA